MGLTVDAKRGVVVGETHLSTGNVVVYCARGLHMDRYGKSKATVEIRFRTAVTDDMLAYTDLDIRDDGDRTHLANSARKHLLSPDPKNSPFAIDCIEWSESVNRHMLDDFCIKFPIALFEGQGAKWGSAGAEISSEDQLIPRFIQRFGGHVLFGPKGSGKTETGILLARCLQFGLDLFGPVAKTVRPMFLQLERSEANFLRSVQLCNRALGLPIEEPILYRVERGRSLAGMVDAIQRDVDTNNVDVLITDSLSRMSEGGSLKDDNTANPIMDRLNAIAPCHIDLAHTSWEGKGDPTKAHVFGSIHFGNAADVVVQIVRQRQDDTHAGVMLTVTDANAFAPGWKTYYAFEYDETGLVSVRPATSTEFPELATTTGLSPAERNEVVWRALTRSMTVAELCETTGLKEDQIENTIRYGRKSFVKTGERPSGSKGGRPRATYGRLASGEYPE